MGFYIKKNEIPYFDRGILEKIQSEDFTIVRTDDIKKRKRFTAIIENTDIIV